MKRIAYVWFAAAVLAALMSTAAGAQQQDSLADYARAHRKDKKQTTAKQFDNDNLPRGEKLSVVGNASDDSKAQAADAPKDGDAQNADTSGQKSAGSEKTPETKPGQSQEREKPYDEWKDKLTAQKDKVELLARELDVLQREYRLRAAAFYADAGNRLRNAGAWDKEDAQYKQQIADKQKAVNDAKQALDILQEQARKSGVPSSVRE